MIPFLLAATTNGGKWKTGVVSGGVLSGTERKRGSFCTDTAIKMCRLVMTLVEHFNE